MDKILVPLDGSTDSEQVLANLRMILRTGLHELALLRVAAMPVSDVHFPIPVVELREEAERYVKAVCARLGTEGVHATGHAAVGDAGAEILRCAAEQGASRRRARGDAMHRKAGEDLLVALAALVGGERHGAAARGELAGERHGGKDVAAGAAGGEHDERGGAHTTSAAP